MLLTMPSSFTSQYHYLSLNLIAQVVCTSKKKGPCWSGKNVDGMTRYFPGGTSLTSNATNPHLK